MKKCTFKRIVFTVTILYLVVGCAPNSHQVRPAIVPTQEYQKYSCSELSEISDRITNKLVSDVIPAQNKRAKSDAEYVMMTIAFPPLILPIILLLPIIGDPDRQVELGNLKGELHAINYTMKSKNCHIKSNAGK